MNAYDYNTQQWVSGLAGAKLLKEQLNAEIHTAIDKGQDYLKAIGCKDNLATYTYKLHQQVVQCAAYIVSQQID